MPKPTTDLDLTFRDISNLTSPDALAAFLTRLGYDTDARQRLTPEAVELSRETAKNVKEIEQLAADEEDLLRVVFVRLKSLTVKARHDLTRVFGKATVEHLLIVTNDFRTIEFLLIDRRTRESRGTDGLPIRQAIPLPVAVDRQAPAAHQLRILRRMTWLEAFDGLDQYDKLTHVFRNAAFAGEFFANRALFSDYYLYERLRDDPAWGENPAEPFRAVGPLVETGRRGSRDTDFDVHGRFYEPILTCLGFAPKRTPRKTPSQPDYLLKDSDGSTLTAIFAYPWDRSLDGPDQGRDNQNPDENPGAVVVTALEEDLADWIIVTNGVSWRLYSKAAHSRATNFYEVDLPAAIEAAEGTDPNDAFRYWWLFFRAEAFTKDDAGTGWLDQIAEGSRDYAKRLGDRLKSRVFEKIFPHLAEGFLLDRRKRMGLKKSPTEDELKEIFEATLTLLYRLLFLLYAESRDLLPVRDTHYAEISLDRLKKEIAEHGLGAESARYENLEKAYSGVKTDLYDRLAILFGVMDKGDRERSVPTYNGGLFRHDTSEAERADEGELVNDEVLLREARIARFLTNHKIPDRHLALALDYLARDEDDKTHSLVFIDYKSLEVRHLGSIYEGLLEFKLKIAEEDLTTKKVKGKEKFIPFGQATARQRRREEVIVQKGKVYLSNDKAERKASGSYYTPDPIVTYIVEHAVGPVLDEKLETLRPTFRKYEKAFRRNLGNANQAFRRQSDGSELAEREWAIQQTYEELGRELVEQLFELRVLDPAMGSGHFLVEVVDFLTDRLLAFLSAFPINPVASLLEKTRREIEDALRVQGLDLDLERLTTPVHLLKRHVLKRCVYGVDLNPMAVELAKVSLWLDAFTLGAPLSFLQHHLRCGNSLIGATFKDLEAATRFGPRQMAMFGMDYEPLQRAVRHVLTVNRSADATAGDVAVSAEKYRQARENLSGYRLLLDLVTAQQFGFKDAKELLTHGDIKFDDAASVFDSFPEDWEQELAMSVHETAREPRNRFFHWEIEFPEVFFAESGMAGQQLKHKNDIKEDSAGFDAVVGNPPYVRMEQIKPLKAHLRAQYRTHADRADLLIYFYERGISALRERGRASFITSSNWTKTATGEGLRFMLVTETTLQVYADLSQCHVFEDVSTYPCILVAERISPTAEHKLRTLNVNSLPDISDARYISAHQRRLPQFELGRVPWNLAEPGVTNLQRKLESAGQLLGTLLGSPLYGIKTGLNEAFVLSSQERDTILNRDPQSSAVIKPFLAGRDVHPWRVDARDNWLIYLPRGSTISKYKGVADHLSQYRERLEKRATSQEWFELQQAQARYAETFENPKIVFSRFMDRPLFALDHSGYYINNALSTLPTDDSVVLFYLMSPITWFFLNIYGAPMANGYRQVHGHVLEKVPIPHFDSKSRRRIEAWFSDARCNGQFDSPPWEILYELFDLSQPEIDFLRGAASCI